nr:glutamate-5-semialdehyde dehydrogenase [Alicyclobacillus cellulosilyticus]
MAGAEAGLKEAIYAQLRVAQRAARALAAAGTEEKNRALVAMADAIWARRDEVLAANAQDVAAAEAAGDTPARIDRLRLTERRLEDTLAGVNQVASLPDPVGTVEAAYTRPNGLRIEKVRVPFGVIAMVYEARPNVTVDAAVLAVKTGNAAVLRGGREALCTNRALAAAMRDGLQRTGLPADAVQLIEHVDRGSVDILIQARGLVDLAIPRGGAGLIQRVVENARVPVIETGVGNCHVYVHADADLAMAERIVLNAKLQRPSVCNAIETVLVDRALSGWLPRLVGALLHHGAEVRACPESLAVLRAAGVVHERLRAATEEDFATEFLAPILALKLVDGLEDAIGHIDRYGTRHSEAIVTQNAQAAETFLKRIDAAAVYHNASTRFTDGFEFGFGAEIGISTQKLHARGPMGLAELTTYKYVVRGTGQVRG